MREELFIFFRKLILVDGYNWFVYFWIYLKYMNLYIRKILLWGEKMILVFKFFMYFIFWKFGVKVDIGIEFEN